MLTAMLAACGGGDPSAGPSPSTPVSSSLAPTTPAPTSTSPSQSEAWRSHFNAAQLRAYDAALQRWEDYESRSEPIWAKGKATAAAKALFMQYYPSPAWVGVWNTLQTYQQAKVKIVGLPKVYWSRGKSITAAASDVVIDQCLDYMPVQRTQDGQAIQPPNPKPQLRIVELYKAPGHDWLVRSVTTSTDKKFRPCEP